MPNLHHIQIVALLLLASVVVFGELARRLRVAYPIVFVLGGLLLSLIPGLPEIHLEPQLIFAVVLPPLLYHAAFHFGWKPFRFNLLSICALAFGLIGVLIAGFALAGDHLFYNLYWKTAFVLGAIVGPTDAIAAIAIAKNAGLPRQVSDLLEGESLLNDATGLLAVQIGVALVAEGSLPPVHTTLLNLALLVLGGAVAGIVVAVPALWIMRRVPNAISSIALSLMVPYVSYLAAETVHTSGIIAVVATGLFLSHYGDTTGTKETRAVVTPMWEAIDFLLNGIVFSLIGLQLPTILRALHGFSTAALVRDGLYFALLLIVMRLALMYPGAWAVWWIRTRVLRERRDKPDNRIVFIVGWAGMRGVISLAAAMALPLTLPDGSAFPQRDFILFLTFSAILVTLVLQGLSLPPIIRALGLGGKAQDAH